MHTIAVDEGDLTCFKSGDARLAPIDMKAGQTIEIETEWNFGDGHVPADWAVTAHGNGGKWGSLTLKHD